MASYTRLVSGLWIGLSLLALVPAPARAQAVIEISFPEPLPYHLGNFDPARFGLEYGTQFVDTAYLLPMLFYRPIDDLTPRPGAQALAMGGACVALAEGPIALGWNPAALAQMRGPAVAVDGLTRSSSGTTEDLPDTVFIEGQPEFRINDHRVSLGGVRSFGFAGGALPVAWFGGRPLVAGAAYRRHTDVAYGEQTVLEMGLFEATTFPLVLGIDNAERGAIESLTLGAGYRVLEIGAHHLAIGATANILTGRLRSDMFSRISVRGFEEGHLVYQTRYKGFSAELGLLAAIGERVRLGAWVGLPHSVHVYDGRFSSLPISTVGQPVIYRLSGTFADYDLEIPLFVSAGAAVGPIHGVELAADINHRPWSDAGIRYRNRAYGLFDADYPGADVTGIHVGGRSEFPWLRDHLHRHGLRLSVLGGYRTMPLSMRDLDIYNGAAPYYLGEGVTGDAITAGLSLETQANVTFHLGFEFQSYRYRKWFLDDMSPVEQRELSFNDPWKRAPILDRAVTVLRFGSEMRF